MDKLAKQERYELMIVLIKEMADTYSKAGNSICFILKDEYDYDYE